MFEFILFEFYLLVVFFLVPGFRFSSIGTLFWVLNGYIVSSAVASFPVWALLGLIAHFLGSLMDHVFVLGFTTGYAVWIHRYERRVLVVPPMVPGFGRRSVHIGVQRSFLDSFALAHNRVMHALNGNIRGFTLVLFILTLVIVTPLWFGEIFWYSGWKKRTEAYLEKEREAGRDPRVPVSLSVRKWLWNWASDSYFGFAVAILVLIVSPILTLVIFVTGSLYMVWLGWRRRREFKRRAVLRAKLSVQVPEGSTMTPDEIFLLRPGEQPPPHADQGRSPFYHEEPLPTD
jgi:hypothetical protein